MKPKLDVRVGYLNANLKERAGLTVQRFSELEHDERVHRVRASAATSPQTTRTRCRRGFRARHRLHDPFRTFLAVKDFHLVRSFTPSNEL